MKRACLTLLIVLLTRVSPAQGPPRKVQSPGTVHIYRSRLNIGTAAHPTVSCDEFPVARMQNGRVYAMQVSAGRHTFALADNPTGIAVDVESGKDHFIRIDFQGATFATSPVLVLVPPEQGRMETLKLRPLDARYIEAATCGRP